MYLVSVEMLARSLAIHAGEHDGVPRAILELIDDGRYEHAHDALRAWAHRPMTDYILLDVIYRRIHEALNHGKRLPGWRPILDSWPGRREEEDYVCLPSLPPLPAHWTIEGKSPHILLQRMGICIMITINVQNAKKMEQR